MKKNKQRCEKVSQDYAFREMGRELDDEPFGLAVYEHKDDYVDIEDWFWFETEEDRDSHIRDYKLEVIDDLK
jgi:hypothetical protein